LLDLQANDVSLLLRYIAATASSQETYRIEAGAADLNLSRESARPVHGRLQATLDLTRSAAYLRSLRITSEAQDKKGRRSSDHTLEISGRLDNFSQPRWQAKVSGDLNMQMLDPVFGYPFAPEGIARLDLDSAGEGGEFRADGTIHIDGGSYIGTGVVATGVGLDAHVHADSRQLLISSIVARLRQGGQLQGDIVLSPWLPNIPAATTVRNPSIGVLRAPADRNPSTLQRPPPIDIPVNGKVTAEFKNVALDTILDMVSQRPFQRLGIDTRLNGKTVATWTHGDTATVVVGALLNLNSPVQSATGEVASYGVIDGTYTQRDGAVDLRKLELHTPASELDAHGHLGAYPLTSPSVTCHILNRHAPPSVEDRANLAHRSLDPVFPRADSSQMRQRSHDTNGAVSAHAQAADIVKKDHTRRAVSIHGLAQQSAHQYFRAPRFVHNGGPKFIVVSGKPPQPVCECIVAQRRPSSNHHPRRFASCMRIDYQN
jgi:translocation and assembly module TamB